MIEARGLEVRRDGRAILAVAALRVERGRGLLVRGRNGSGKTTLLRLCAGLERPDAGTLEVAVPRSERVLVHQAPLLLRGTVVSNVAYGLRARGVDRRRRLSLVASELEALGVAHLAERSGRELSGGETRRVALARALVLRPRLLLLDEPFSDLDPDAARLVRERLEAPEVARDLTLLLACPTGESPLPGADALELGAGPGGGGHRGNGGDAPA